MKTIVWITLCAALVACGDKQEPAPTTKKAPEVSTELAAAMASSPLGDGMSVADAKAKQSADEVVVVGRINNIVAGFAAFNITDLKLEYCGEKTAEDCKTPWDYCCTPNKEQTANRISVAIYGKDGEILRAPELGNLRLLDKVTVKGKLTTDEHGNTELHATLVHRDERPTLPDGLRWP